MRLHRMLLRACVPLLALWLSAAGAQEYPTRPIKLVVPLAPGGSADIMARAIAEKLSERLGQPVVVENKPGANSIVGTVYVAQAKPDGYTLLMAYDAHASNPFIYKNMTYDAVKDFQPVTQVSSLPMVVIVNPALPARSLPDLVALAKASPGKLTYSSAGVGSSQHLVTVLLANAAGIELSHIPYKEGAVTAVVGGHVSMMIPSMVSVLPQINGGTVRALAITTDKRAPQLPNLPTVKESLGSDFNFAAWIGILAPAGTPRPIVNKLRSEVAAILSSSEIEKKFGDKMQLVGSTPEEFSALIDTDMKRWQTAVKAAGITLQ